MQGSFGDLRFVIRPVSIRIAARLVKDHPIEWPRTVRRLNGAYVPSPTVSQGRDGGGRLCDCAGNSVRPETLLHNLYAVARTETRGCHAARSQFKDERCEHDADESSNDHEARHRVMPGTLFEA